MNNNYVRWPRHLVSLPSILQRVCSVVPNVCVYFSLIHLWFLCTKQEWHILIRRPNMTQVWLWKVVQLLWHPTNLQCDKSEASTYHRQEWSLREIVPMIRALHHSALRCQIRSLSWQDMFRAQQDLRNKYIFFCVDSRRFWSLSLRNLSFLLPHTLIHGPALGAISRQH